jgi:hypothetical protein
MKLIGTLVLFIVLLGSALAENKVEFHSDHDAQDEHSTELSFHTDSHNQTTKNSGTQAECDHYHVHCSNLCLGVLIPNKQNFPSPSSSLTMLSFNQPLLMLKDFSNSLYRPPIA